MRQPTFFIISLLLLALIGSSAQAQDTALRLGTQIDDSLVTGELDGYSFEVAKDYFVRGAVNQVTVDVVVKVFSPSGELIDEIDGPARGLEAFQFSTKEAGTFRIEISPFEEEEGNYEVLLTVLEPVATDPEGKVNQLLAAYDGETTPGAAVSVWRDGKAVFSNTYGMANLTYGIPFEEDTRTNIGSTSKQFTAFAVMLLVDEGKLSLDDDVRVHIPELPDLGETVTVRNLVTHTSGYREFLNLLIMSGRRLDYGDYIDRAELIDIVKRQPALQNSPGAEWNYNNTAFGLAAVIVERISGQHFPDFMKEQVFEPIGMHDTEVRRSPDHTVLNRSAGYAPDSTGAFVEKRDIGAAIGAGGIYSTLADLQLWVENIADPHIGNKDIFKQMMTSFVLNNGEETGYGFGLFIDEQNDLRRIHHGGADSAHRSMLAYYPELNAGVTAQSNHAGFNASMAFEIAEYFFEELQSDDESESTDSSADTFDPSRYDPASFDEVVGKYSLDEAPAFILTFSREDSTFYTQATGQQKLEIRPTSDSTFALIVVEASMTFHRNAEGKVDGLTMNQNGLRHATRIEETTVAWTPVLENFVGRYFSEEIETFFNLIVQDSSLVMQHRRIDDMKLSSGEEDAFTSQAGQVRFERDEQRKVVRMFLANGRTRDIRFDKTK